MSLWYESLGLCLYDCGENQEERGKCIVEHLSMPVARSWWEHALKTGSVDSTYVRLLQDAQTELSKLTDLPFQLSSGLLVALAFINDDADGTISGPSGDVDNQDSIQDYLIKAGKVLIEPLELCWLGRLIDKEITQEEIANR